MIQHFHHAGHTLTWEEHSPGSHTLIFINGYSANRHVWAREVAYLAHVGRCVTLDLPGHFPAEAPPGYRALSQAELLDLELRAIRAIVGTGTCTIIGHSAGGFVALAAAARLPALVRRIICLTPVVWGPLTGVLGFFQRLLALPGGYALYWCNYRLSQRSRQYVQRGTALGYSGNAAAYLRNPAAAEVFPRWYPTYTQARIRNLATLLMTLRHGDIRPEVAHIRCPVLVIAGAADPVVPLAQLRWLADHLPDVELQALPGVGHVPQWEAAQTVEPLVLRWLTEHPVQAPDTTEGQVNDVA